jgi:hypothetical protein
LKRFQRHIEWGALLAGLILMGTMNPYSNGTTWCLLEHAGLYCPGEGLGHSIAFFFRGEFGAAFNANLMGPFAVVILSARIIKIWADLYKEQKRGFTGDYYGQPHS